MYSKFNLHHNVKTELTMTYKNLLLIVLLHKNDVNFVKKIQLYSNKRSWYVIRIEKRRLFILSHNDRILMEQISDF